MAHITTIEIENFRIFCEKTKLDFAPITILTGSNNSGKSSIIKLFLLLQHSINSYKRFENLDFSGGKHYLSDIKNVLCNSTEIYSNKLVVALPFSLLLQDNLILKLEYSCGNSRQKNYKPSLDGISIIDKQLDKIFLQFNSIPVVAEKQSENPNDSVIISYSIYFDTFLFKAYLKELLKQWKNKKKKDQDMKTSPSGKYGFDFSTVSEESDEYSYHIDSFEERIKSNKYLKLELIPLSNDFYKNVFNENDLNEIDQIYSLIKEDIISENIDITGMDMIRLEQESGNYNYTSSLWDHFFDFFLQVDLIENSNIKFKESRTIRGNFFGLLYRGFDYSFERLANEVFNTTSHLSSLRGNLERAYNQEGGAFNNLITEYARINLSERVNQLESIFLSDWIKRFGIEDYDDINVTPAHEVNLNFVKLKNHKTGKGLALIDLGFGTSQLVSILLKIVIEANKHSSNPSYGYNSPASYLPHTLLIEEPEANLHPNWQSLLADMFIDAAERFNTQFIIETHSEYLIRKLQYWTAKKVIKPDDTVIYYMNNPKDIASGKLDKTEQIQKITIQSDGRLDKEFGKGFFDEAVNLMMSIYKSSKNN